MRTAIVAILLLAASASWSDVFVRRPFKAAFARATPLVLSQFPAAELCWLNPMGSSDNSFFPDGRPMYEVATLYFDLRKTPYRGNAASLGDPDSKKVKKLIAKRASEELKTENGELVLYNYLYLNKKPVRRERATLRQLTRDGQLYIIAKLESNCPRDIAGTASCPTGFLEYNYMEFKANYYQSPCK
ncbi:MAG TPA: hypothetical protein VFV50_08595 [Bdellovibrionales bacterium]|nr:hypothetical protein [Bdellovibrionales bacterium]